VAVPGSASGNYVFDNYMLKKNCFRNLVPKNGSKIDIVKDYKWTECLSERARTEVPKIHLKLYQQTHHALVGTLNRWYLMGGLDNIIEASGLLDPAYVWETPYNDFILGEEICEIVLPFVSDEIGSSQNRYQNDTRITDFWKNISSFSNFAGLPIFLGLGNIGKGLLKGVGHGIDKVEHIPGMGLLTTGLALFGASKAIDHIIPKLDSYASITKIDVNHFEFFEDSTRKEFSFDIELLNTDDPSGEVNVVRNFEFVNFLLYNFSPRRRNMIVRDVPVVCECFTGTQYLPYAAVDVVVSKKGKSRIVQKGKLKGQTIPDAYNIKFNIRLLMENDGRFALQALNGFNPDGTSNVLGSTKVFTNKDELVQAARGTA